MADPELAAASHSETDSGANGSEASPVRSLPAWAALLTVPMALVLTALAVVYTLKTSVPASAFDGRTGWDAAGVGDYRIAADYFLSQVEADSTTIAGHEGAVCVLWFLGHQDHALWLHQIYVSALPRHFVETRGYENRCAELADWGVDIVSVGDPLAAVVIVDPRGDADGIELEKMVRDSSLPTDTRLLAATCLNDRMGFRALTSIQATWVSAITRSDATRERSEREGSVLHDCLHGPWEYEWIEREGGFWVAQDFFEILFVPSWSPVVRPDLLIPAPFPRGPDGELVGTWARPSD